MRRVLVTASTMVAVCPHPKRLSPPLPATHFAGTRPVEDRRGGTLLVVLAVIGTVLGASGGLVLTRFLSTLLFGISATDPAIYLAASALLLVVAIAACFWPARKASAVQPLEALRYE